MKNILSFGLLFLSCLITMVACNKDPQDKSKTELITKNWKVRQVTRVSDGQSEIVYTDPQGTIPNSVNYTNYRLIFNADKSFSRTEITGNVTTGNWEFQDGETKVSFSAGSPSEVTVKELKDNSLQISYTETSPKTGERETIIQLVPAQ